MTKLQKREKTIIAILLPLFGMLFIGCMILFSAIITTIMILLISILVSFFVIVLVAIFTLSFVLSDYIKRFNDDAQENK